MKESGEIVSSTPFARVPYPPLRGPFPKMGKAKRRRLRRPKRKPTPPRRARQPLPRERPLKNPLKNKVWNMLFGNRVTI